MTLLASKTKYIESGTGVSVGDREIGRIETTFWLSNKEGKQGEGSQVLLTGGQISKALGLLSSDEGRVAAQQLYCPPGAVVDLRVDWPVALEAVQPANTHLVSVIPDLNPAGYTLKGRDQSRLIILG